MPVSIQMPGKIRSPIEAIGDALGVVDKIYGIKADRAALDKYALELKAQEGLQNAASAESEAARTGYRDLGFKVGDDESSSAMERKFGKLADLSKAKFDADLRKKGDSPLLQYQMQNAMLENQKKRMDLQNEANGKALPASEAVSFGGANAAVSALSDVSSLIGENQNDFGPLNGTVSRLQAAIGAGEGGKRTGKIEAALGSRAQIIGKYLEGGKLTDSDIDRYKTMLPNFRDAPEVAQAKVENLQRLVTQKQEAEKAALAQGGFNVQDLQGSPVNPMMSAAPNKANKSPLIPDVFTNAKASKDTPLTVEDLEALQWAKANPGHPRIRDVMGILHLKGVGAN